MQLLWTSLKPLIRSRIDVYTMQQLHYYEMRGAVLDWIDNFLINHSQKVVLDGCFSDMIPVPSGVPQGIVLGPLYYCFSVSLIIYLNMSLIKSVYMDMTSYYTKS